MASVAELGYIGVEASDLGAWETFGTTILGFTVARKEAGLVAFQLDGKVHRIVVEQGPSDDLSYAGYGCESESDLEAIAAALRAHGAVVEEGDAELAARRRVRRIVHTTDPAGNRVELYVGLADASQPYTSDVTRSGFLTGSGGAGHMFLVAPDRQAMLDFYALLGFKLSDYIVQQLGNGDVVDAAFTHCNGRHHTLAFAAIPMPKRMHHIMLEVNDIQDVGVGYDRVLDHKVPLELTLGMHPNDRMFSFYVRTPSGFSIEYGYGGVVIDDSDWQVVTHDRLSSWGHRPPKMVSDALV